MSETQVRLSKTAATRCTDLTDVHASAWLQGLDGKRAFEEGLDYTPDKRGNPHKDRISRESACIFAARYARAIGDLTLPKCGECEYFTEALHNDPIVEDLI